MYMLKNQRSHFFWAPGIFWWQIQQIKQTVSKWFEGTGESSLDLQGSHMLLSGFESGMSPWESGKNKGTRIQFVAHATRPYRNRTRSCLWMHTVNESFGGVSVSKAVPVIPTLLLVDSLDSKAFSPDPRLSLPVSQKQSHSFSNFNITLLGN